MKLFCGMFDKSTLIDFSSWDHYLRFSSSQSLDIQGAGCELVPNLIFDQTEGNVVGNNAP